MWYIYGTANKAGKHTHNNSFMCLILLFALKKVMKSPIDTSIKLERDRHQNEMKIDNAAVQVFQSRGMLQWNGHTFYILRKSKENM